VWRRAEVVRVALGASEVSMRALSTFIAPRRLPLWETLQKGQKSSEERVRKAS
jgi:hypothetical protein